VGSATLRRPTSSLGAAMKGSDLLGRLRVLETELHRLRTRQNTNRLERLLHPDFEEFARWGGEVVHMMIDHDRRVKHYEVVG
jgi:hypothetical protein